MPQALEYTFAPRINLEEGQGHAFDLALTREMLHDVQQITVRYYINGAPIEAGVPQDTMGVMRSMVTAVPINDPAFFQLEARYNNATFDATSYVRNPRNLESPWKGVYNPVLLGLIHGLYSCDVLQESPIWMLKDASTSIPLNTTISMPRGGGKTVFPDLSIVMYRGTLDMQNCRAAPDRLLPVLVELKRAISRSLTVRGYPILTNTLAVQKLAGGFALAQPQIELTAYLHLTKCTDQTHIVLIAGVGPWFRGLYVDRAAVLTYVRPRSEIDAARQINEVLEDQTDGREDPPLPQEAYISNEVSDANFWAIAGRRFDGLSYLQGWSQPMMLGSPAAVRFWDITRYHIRLMLSGR